jgi:hypothetical protein
MRRLSSSRGASTFWNPQGLSRPVMGLLYLYLTSSNTGTVLSRNVAQLDAIIVLCICHILSSIVVLSPNGNFFVSYHCCILWTTCTSIKANHKPADRVLYSHFPTTPAVTPVYESMACIGKCRVLSFGSDGGFCLQGYSVLRHFDLNVWVRIPQLAVVTGRSLMVINSH